MDYKIFSKDHYNIAALNCREISDPLIGLKEFLIGRSATQFKRDLRDLLMAVYEKHGWRQHGAPVNLYAKAKDIAKLMDFVWLITTCEVGGQREEADLERHYLAEQYRHRTFFSKLFFRAPAKKKGKPVAGRSLARAIFEERHGLLIKDNIEEMWLSVALNSSYMRNLTIDFYCIESLVDVKDYWYMTTIVDAAFELANQPVRQLDAEKLNYYRLFAADVDHPDQLAEEDIELIFQWSDGIFWSIDEVRFPKAVRKWYSLIFKTNHWNDHNDPGNMLFIKAEIQRLIETAWLWSRVGLPALSNHGVDEKYVKDLSAEQLADPIAYVDYFFDQHRLHEWKYLLETWLIQSLSDKSPVNTVVTRKECEDIIKLIQVVRLIARRI